MYCNQSILQYVIVLTITFSLGATYLKGHLLGILVHLLKKGDLEGRPFLERGAFWKETTEIKLFLQYTVIGLN